MAGGLINVFDIRRICISMRYLNRDEVTQGAKNMYA